MKSGIRKNSLYAKSIICSGTRSWYVCTPTEANIKWMTLASRGLLDVPLSKLESDGFPSPASPLDMAGVSRFNSAASAVGTPLTWISIVGWLDDEEVQSEEMITRLVGLSIFGELLTAKSVIDKAVVMP